LLFAGEHLRLARDALEARQVYPSAHFTVLRGALVGAAQAVWILGAKDGLERQERGLMLIGEMYGQLRIFYREMESTALSAEDKHQLEDQIGWCEQRRAQVKELRRTAEELNQTKFISWALNHTFTDDRRREAGRLLWRQMSADAHVLGWSVFQRATVQTFDRRTGIGVMESGGDLAHLAEPFAAAHLILKEGWSLFDRLCEGPGERRD
jgi:hypothetical protein